MSSRSIYQTRRNAASDWTPLTENIATALQRNGMRHGEVMGHIVDLQAGHVLTAENGRGFRALEEPPLPRPQLTLVIQALEDAVDYRETDADDADDRAFDQARRDAYDELLGELLTRYGR